MLAAVGLELGVEAEVDERVLGGGRDDVDGAAVAAVAAVGTAARDELLAAEAEAAAPAVAGGDVDVHLVDEHPLSVYGLQRRSADSGEAAGYRLPDQDRSLRAGDRSLLLNDRNDRDLAAVLAVILEADLAVDLREQRVVLAETDVQAGLEAAALLPHEDRPAGDEHCRRDA